jgi:hypothetical protein
LQVDLLVGLLDRGRLLLLVEGRVGVDPVDGGHIVLPGQAVRAARADLAVELELVGQAVGAVVVQGLLAVPVAERANGEVVLVRLPQRRQGEVDGRGPPDADGRGECEHERAYCTGGRHTPEYWIPH